jgi:hypothetical protein
MKASAVIISTFCCLCFVGCVDTQQDYHINAMDKNGAVLLASHLRYGMPEEEAVSFLKVNGLTNMSSVGGSITWGDCFSLSNHYSLCITISPKQVSPYGAWVNGLVRKACIYHWNGKENSKEASIKLTDGP